MLAIFREQKRRRLREQPFPPAWETILQQNVAYLALLNAEEQSRLRGDIQVFIEEKYWEGCNGLVMTEEMRVTVAAYACLLQLNQEQHDYYPNVRSILLYPNSYRVRRDRRDASGVINRRIDWRAGEAWDNGPVVLSWEDILRGSRNHQDGRNVILHEFAHKLDMLETTAWGVPALKSQEAFDLWSEVMSAEYALLVQQTEAGEESLIDPYGATEPAEFFAVATETFFEKPRQLAQQHPRLYEIFRAFYRQDPAARLA